MSTYSVTLTAQNTGEPPSKNFLPANIQLEDAYSLPREQVHAMKTNTQVQCKNPDGSVGFYTIDASRSDPSKNLIYLLKV